MRYLDGALPDRVDELLDDQVNAFEARFLQLYDLLFHDGLERQVRGEQTRPESPDTHTHVHKQRCETPDDRTFRTCTVVGVWLCCGVCLCVWYLPHTVDVFNSVADLSPQLFLIKLHLTLHTTYVVVFM